jgi:glycosyltransferase involved in cell wall biosynthesis
MTVPVKPLNVLIVTPRFWPLSGENERALARLTEALTARGCQVTVLTARLHPGWPAELRFGNAELVRLSPPPQGRWNTWRYTRGLAGWLRRHESRFDLVYVWSLANAAYAALRSVGRRLPVILQPWRIARHGDCLWQIETRGGGRIKDECMKAAAFVASTPAVRRELEAAGYPRPRIRDLPLGISLQPPRDRARRNAARSLLAEANPALRLAEWAQLAVCGDCFEPGGGWDELLSAWPAVVRRFPNARLWLAGEVADPAAINGRIAALGLSGRAELIGAFDEIDILLEAADFFVAPAPQGSPLAVLEAMAASLPVVASNTPANRHLVTPEQDGLLAAPGDTAGLSAAMARLLAEPELAGRLGAAARQRAADFPLDKMVDEHLGLFTEVPSPSRSCRSGTPCLTIKGRQARGA